MADANRSVLRESGVRLRRRGFGDEGYGMVALLAVVLILGVLAAIVLGGGTATPQPVADASPGHVLSACLSDYASVDEAVQSYFAAHIAEPPAGVAWATSSAKGGPYLQSWPDDKPYYDITWNGSLVAVQPAHGSLSIGSAGTRSPATGCYAAAR